MDGKLVLDEKYYYLEIQHERIGKMIVGSSDHELSKMINQPFKLSINNCEAVANGYDLDELVKTTFPSLENCGVYLWMSETDRNRQRSAFIKGFQKAIELLGDKKFTINDILVAMVCMQGQEVFYEKTFEETQEARKLYIENYIKHLQQIEWDVEVEMESNLHIGEVVDESYPNDFPLERPKLDTNGCIILKRK